ncbi:MAG: tyrosine-type recombinase/integrase [Gemmatimonadetes bacterium]|nr:tyrosine-type recombinase/integrase [Gemmatimonadota bacterium]
MPTQIEVLNPGMSLARRGDAWETLAGIYRAELESRGSTRTAGEYLTYVRQFLEALQAAGREPAEATPGMVHAFSRMPVRGTDPPSASTVIVRLAAIRGYYRLAQTYGLATTDPTAGVKGKTPDPPQARGLEPAEIRALMTAFPNTPAGDRDRAAVTCLVLTGLRRSELFGLTRGAIEERGGIVSYRTRLKGGKMRRRELPRPAYRAIVRALARLGTPLDTLPDDAPLFPISSAGFYANLRRAAKRAGLEGVTPHVLRHTAAKLRHTTGANVESVRTFLGHAHLQTTERYLRQFETEADPDWRNVAAALGIDAEEMNV